MVSVFTVDDTPTMPGYYIIRINHEAFHLGPTVGSYNLIIARLLNISYANYLRLCRDEFSAMIVGKNTYYPVAYFADKFLAERLCKLLNARAEYVLTVKATPDHEEHKKEIIRMQKEQQTLREGQHATFINPITEF